MIVVLNDTRVENHHGCSIVMKVIDDYLASFKQEVVYFPCGSFWEESLDIQEKIKESSILIVNGEGTIHHNAPRGISLLKAAKFASDYGVKSYLINATYQENSTLCKEYLQFFERIYVRESFSKKEIESLEIKAEVIPDLTFAHSSYFDENKNLNLSSPKLLVTDSVVKEQAKELEQFYPNSKMTFVSIFSTKMSKWKYFRRKYIYRRDIIPRKTFKLHEDFQLQIASNKGLLCGRFHAMTIALLERKSFLCLESNTHKMSGTLIDIGLDPKKFIKQELSKEMIDSFDFEFTKEELEKINVYILSAQEKIKAMFTKICVD